MNICDYSLLRKRNIIALSLGFVLLFTQCGSDNGNSQEPKHYPSADTALVISSPPLLTEAFADFLKGFSANALPQRYDAKWLKGFQTENTLKEISSKDCEKYLYGKKVLNSDQALSRGSAASYYYAHQLPSKDGHITLVVINYAAKKGHIYLITYSRSGEHIQSLLLYQEGSDSKASSRYGLVSETEENINIEVGGKKTSRYVIREGGEVEPLRD